MPPYCPSPESNCFMAKHCVFRNWTARQDVAICCCGGSWVPYAVSVTSVWTHSETGTHRHKGRWVLQELTPSSSGSSTCTTLLLQVTRAGVCQEQLCICKSDCNFPSPPPGSWSDGPGHSFDNEIRLWVRAASLPECLLNLTAFQSSCSSDSILSWNV